MNTAIEAILRTTTNTEYEGFLYLVGGCVRDKILKQPQSSDYDFVLEGDAIELAQFLYNCGVADHHPVTYPRFGTALVTIDGTSVEFVTARAESYDPTHRKPSVTKASLKDDAFRRDFTINTLMENLHTGELLDITGLGLQDIKDGVIRTPLDPETTFYDDPLRMLRAIRFSARFGFSIVPETLVAICKGKHRLSLVGNDSRVVSAERVRDEFLKIIGNANYVKGILQLSEVGLLQQILPELDRMRGVTQNAWHTVDVWDHTMLALTNLDPAASVNVRLAALFHDVGKPATRTEDERGVHFYDHQSVGAHLAHDALHRLKLGSADIREVVSLVGLHMRLGEYRSQWQDSSVKRLIRAISPYEKELFTIARADLSAMRTDVATVDLNALKLRMDEIQASANVLQLNSPLDGNEIIETLLCSPGPIIKTAKEYLLNLVIDGKLEMGDKVTAGQLLREWYTKQ